MVRALAGDSTTTNDRGMAPDRVRSQTSEMSTPPPRRVTGEVWAHPWLGKVSAMVLILWILAVILVIAGILAIVRGQVLWGIVLIIVGLLVGPGGVSVFNAVLPGIF